MHVGQNFTTFFYKHYNISRKIVISNYLCGYFGF